MAALFFITTVVFLVLFIEAKLTNSKLRSEINKLREELWNISKNSKKEEENAVKAENFAEQTTPEKTASPHYDTSYKPLQGAAKPQSFTAASPQQPQEKPKSIKSAQ